MKQAIYAWLQAYLNRSPQRRQRLWKSLRSEFEPKVNKSDELREKWPQLKFASPGHFYSPLPDIEYALLHHQRLMERRLTSLPGIQLNAVDQLTLSKKLAPYYEEFDWPVEATSERRYKCNNDQYLSGDAACLYAMIRNFEPKQIIEIGSGYSSGLMIDYNELNRGPKVDLTFIEPYPKRLNTMTVAAGGHYRLIEKLVQEVDLTIYDRLGSGDFLFIDSSHVSKTGSDLNHIIFEIIPRLAPGVFVHFHDIFWPFEYPEAWIREGRAWNENYMLRSLLSYNSAWEIIIFGQYLGSVHRNEVPPAMRKLGFGGYLWMRKAT